MDKYKAPELEEVSLTRRKILVAGALGALCASLRTPPEYSAPTSFNGNGPHLPYELNGFVRRYFARRVAIQALDSLSTTPSAIDTLPPEAIGAEALDAPFEAEPILVTDNPQQ